MKRVRGKFDVYCEGEEHKTVAYTGAQNLPDNTDLKNSVLLEELTQTVSNLLNSTRFCIFELSDGRNWTVRTDHVNEVYNYELVEVQP